MRSRWLAAWLAVALAACASSSKPGPESRPDRTRDPEFEAARKAARPEFETQADALAAGVYERFVHPDSIGPDATEPVAWTDAGTRLTTPRERGDPSTSELLGTLGADGRYNRADDLAPRSASVVSPDAPPTGVWTLQIGAFGSESGALVRRQELERRFPDLPVRIVTGRDGLVRVHLGSFAERVAAERALERVAEKGYPDAWITHVP